MSNLTNERNNNLENGISIRISPELFAKIKQLATKHPSTNLGFARLKNGLNVEKNGEHMEAVLNIEETSTTFELNFSTHLVDLICDHAVMAWPIMKSLLAIAKNMAKKISDLFPNASDMLEKNDARPIQIGDKVTFNYVVGDNPEIMTTSVIVGSGEFNKDVERDMTFFHNGSRFPVHINVLGTKQKATFDITDVEYLADLPHHHVDRNCIVVVKHSTSICSNSLGDDIKVRYLKYVFDKFGNLQSCANAISGNDLHLISDSVYSSIRGAQLGSTFKIFDDDITILKIVGIDTMANDLDIFEIISEDLHADREELVTTMESGHADFFIIKKDQTYDTDD